MDMSDRLVIEHGLRGTLARRADGAPRELARGRPRARSSTSPPDVDRPRRRSCARCPRRAGALRGPGQQPPRARRRASTAPWSSPTTLWAASPLDGPLRFRAGAGVPAPHLARFVARHGGGGAEWMAGVPGTVGGALAMNAGCYGGETWNHVVAVETIDRAGQLHRRAKDEFESATGTWRRARRRTNGSWARVLAFAPGEEAPAMARMRELLARRVATQPLRQPNAGSVFRNPPGDHAARLDRSLGPQGLHGGRRRRYPRSTRTSS